MAYKVSLDRKAEEDFSKLDKAVQRRLFKYMKRIEEREDPRTLGEQLQENLSAYWKFRVGDYRLIAEIIDDRVIVLMLVIAHRRAAHQRGERCPMPPPSPTASNNFPPPSTHKKHIICT